MLRNRTIAFALLGCLALSGAASAAQANEPRDHVATRLQFGRPLCEFQGLQWKFADMALKLEGAQLLLYRAAANADSGLPSAYETSLAKAACNLAGFDVAYLLYDAWHLEIDWENVQTWPPKSCAVYCRSPKGWGFMGRMIRTPFDTTFA